MDCFRFQRHDGLVNLLCKDCTTYAINVMHVIARMYSVRCKPYVPCGMDRHRQSFQFKWRLQINMKILTTRSSSSDENSFA